MSNRQSGRVALGVSALAAIGGTYLVGRATAAVPTTDPFFYAGVLTDNNGIPVSGSRNIQVSLWDDPTDTATVRRKCGPVGGVQTIAGGHFSVRLDDPACVTAIHAIPDLFVQIDVDTATLIPRSKIGAVPYALEADKATSAGHANTSDDASSLGGVVATSYARKVDIPLNCQTVTVVGNAPTNTFTQTATCPAGTKLVGGGFKGPSTAAYFESFPSSGTQAWTCSVFNQPGSGFQAQCFARCCTP